MHLLLLRGTQAGFLDKGKPVARPGRKAMGLVNWRDRQAAEENHYFTLSNEHASATRKFFRDIGFTG